jgi:hypothetical protein
MSSPALELLQELRARSEARRHDGTQQSAARQLLASLQARARQHLDASSEEDGSEEEYEEWNGGSDRVDSDDDAGPRLAGRVLTHGGAQRRHGSRKQSASQSGWQRDYGVNAQWLLLRKADGSDMFTSTEVRSRRGAGTMSVGERLHKLLEEHPRLEYPPSRQPGNVHKASRFQRVRRLTIGLGESSRSLGTVSARISGAIKSTMNCDVKAMRASCGYQACPACRLPEHMQPDERPIFVQDIIYWWNACRGKCMGSKCRRPVAFYIPYRESSADGWTLQRKDNRLNHIPSNVVGVLCRQCNSAIPRPACIGDCTGTML